MNGILLNLPDDRRFSRLRQIVLCVSVAIGYFFGVPVGAQQLDTAPAPSGGNPVGAWLAETIPLQVYASPDLAFLTVSLEFGGSVSGSLELESDSSYTSDYIVTATVSGTLGIFPIDLAISDTSRSTGTFTFLDSLLVLSDEEAADSLLYTVDGDTLRLIQSVPLGTYQDLVNQLAPGAENPLSVLRLSRETPGGGGGEGVAAADFNGDGRVGFGDFLLLAIVFGTSEGDAGFDALFDLSGDGRVDFSDFLTFASFFGRTVESSGS